MGGKLDIPGQKKLELDVGVDPRKVIFENFLRQLAAYMERIPASDKRVQNMLNNVDFAYAVSEMSKIAARILVKNGE
jgi:hypothetical protein